MFGVNGAELIVILVVAVLVIGPERLPRYAEQLGAFVRKGRSLLQDAKSRVDTELGDEFRDVDWSKLDPRQYDPRRIVREALLDDAPPAAAGARAATATAAAAPVVVPVPGAAPFDDEAT